MIIFHISTWDNIPPWGRERPRNFLLKSKKWGIYKEKTPHVLLTEPGLFPLKYKTLYFPFILTMYLEEAFSIPTLLTKRADLKTF